MAIKFEEDQAVILRFPFAGFQEVEGNFGQQYLYSVDTGSRFDRLYANPALHFRLQEHGLTPGCIVSITPTRGPGRRRQWVVTSPVAVEPPPGPTPPELAAKLPRKAEAPAPAATPAAPAPTNGNGHPPAVTQSDQPPVAPARTNSAASAPPLPSAPANGQAKPGTNGRSKDRSSPADLANLTQLMGHCLSASIQAWASVKQVQYAPADIRAVGITLFLECSRRCVAPEPVVLGPAFVDKVLDHTDDLPF